jgi:sugar phosphate isomerase/epimerase
MRLGLGSYALAWAVGVPGYPPPQRPLDAFGLLAAARETGASFVQFGDNLPLEMLMPDDLRRLRREALEAGLALEVGCRGTGSDRLLRYLAIAQDLGACLVRTLITEPGIPGLAAAEPDLRAALPAFEHAGVTLAVENYDAHPVLAFAGLIRRLDSPSLGVCLDTLNSLGALESPAAVIDALLPLAASIHVKDFTIRRVEHRMGFVVEGTPAGKGRLDIPGMIAGARACGRDPGVVLELWTPWQGSIEATVEQERAWARESMSYLGRIVE